MGVSEAANPQCTPAHCTRTWQGLFSAGGVLQACCTPQHFFKNKGASPASSASLHANAAADWFRTWFPCPHVPLPPVVRRAGLAASHDGSLCVSISRDRTAKVFDVVGFDMIMMMKLSFTPGVAEWVFKVRAADR